ncbi:efflux RND transporter periplasmic adaptor subunit [Terrilactibacillus laevilacticus]|uniref:Efflux RND transporter periplasmic adaptor subunit n=1 Tax=Terrilactibacillus laevilacticus TaxID=1380157 RepID=A0ABW5PRL9_9BACI|nr:HlyD family efflux transporter periplasmic adaptor subunit [Terrilactibacillus laevilacticus]
MKKWIISAIIVVIIIGGGTTWYVKQQSQPAVARSITQTATVQKGTIESKISDSGTLESAIDKDIEATESKTISEINVSEDDTVEKGDTLLTYTDGTILTAPYDGTITKINVTEDGMTKEGQAAFHIINYKSFNTVLQVDELDIPKVKVGQNVNITVNAYDDEKFTGKVTSIAKEGDVSNGVSTFDVTVHVTHSKATDSLKIGMSATADIITSKKNNILYVPVDAIHKSGNQSYVITTQANSQDNTNNESKNQVAVTTGINNDSFIEIKSGLQEGETVQLPSITRSSSSSSSSSSASQSQFGRGMINGGNFGGNFGGGQRQGGMQQGGGNKQ